jgi:UrcA family protein
LRKSIALLASLAVAAAGLGPAVAAEQPPRVTVHFSDLDLATDHDAAVLMDRLQQAGLQACGGSSFSVPDYKRAIQHSACYRRSVNQAIDAVGAPTLVRLRNERGGFDEP